MKFLLILSVFLIQQPLPEHLNLKDGLAVSGYDLFSYFEEEEPSKGSKNIQVIHDDITYRFKNEANKAKFQASPEQYLPAYGGWCAYAMGVSGDKVKIDPETYKITGGKLYLFYNFWGNNTLKSWNEDESGLKTGADKYWSQIISSK